MKKNLTPDSCKSHTDDMWCTCFIIKSVDHSMIDFLYPFDKVLFQGTHMRHLFIQVCVNRLCCQPDSCNPRYIFCSGTHVFLLLASENDRFYFCFFIDIDKTDSLRSMDLMSAYRKHIDSHLFRVNLIFSKSLYCIHMEQDIFIISLYDRRCFCNRLNRSHFVIHIHDRYQDRLVTERFL